MCTVHQQIFRKIHIKDRKGEAAIHDTVRFGRLPASQLGQAEQREAVAEAEDFHEILGDGAAAHQPCDVSFFKHVGQGPHPDAQ